MKIKNVIKSCKARRTIQVVVVGSGDYLERWLGDGRSLWVMPEWMNCDQESIFGIYDFSETEQEKTEYILKSAKDVRLDFKDSEESGDVDLLGVVLNINGAEYRPIKTEEGVIYIEEKYFSIFADKQFSLKSKYMPDGSPYIAVYEGLLMIGIILPSKIETPALCDALGIMYYDMKGENGKLKMGS